MSQPPGTPLEKGKSGVVLIPRRLAEVSRALHGSFAGAETPVTKKRRIPQVEDDPEAEEHLVPADPPVIPVEVWVDALLPPPASSRSPLTLRMICG